MLSSGYSWRVSVSEEYFTGISASAGRCPAQPGWKSCRTPSRCRRGRLVQGRAAVGVAVGVAGVGALHDAEDIGGSRSCWPTRHSSGRRCRFCRPSRRTCRPAWRCGRTCRRWSCSRATFWLSSTKLLACFSLAGMVKVGRREMSTKASKLIRYRRIRYISTAVVTLPLSRPQASVQVLPVVPMRWERVFIWLTQPARSPPERLVRQAHRGLVGVPYQHGVEGFPVGEGLAGAHVCVVGVVDVIRDGERHLERCCRAGRRSWSSPARWSYIWSGPRQRPDLGAVLVVDDDVGVGVDDVGAPGPCTS